MGGATRFLFLLTPSPLLRHRCPSLLRLFRRQLHHQHHHRHRLHSPLGPTTTRRLLPIESSRQLHTQPSSPLPFARHPCPEFHALLDNLSACGYFNRLRLNTDDDFVAAAELPQDFVRAASACLSFARERPNLLGMVSRRDVEVLVKNGMPFLFKKGDESVRRMKSFVGNEVLDVDEANTVDLMKFLLSYVSDLAASLETNNLYDRELVESSVRNLFDELAKLSYGTPESKFSLQNQFPDRNGQMLRTSGQNIQMKRGDWICQRCSFMNFTRNAKCLKCDGARPKRQLAGGEWDCPQCDFFNYSRNMECLRCDCKRPGEVSYATANSTAGSGYGYGGSAMKDDIESRLAANEEKAQRSGSKVEDEDFPGIMPLRKGVNRFVVSTRKTPLERRLANAEYQRNSGNDGLPEGNDVQMGRVDETPDTKFSRTLDDIFGRSPASYESNYNSVTTDQNARADSSPPFSSIGSSQYGNPRGSNSNYVPFVPLPADMFANQTENAKVDKMMHAVLENNLSDASDTVEQSGAISRGSEFDNSVDNLPLSEKPVNQKVIKDKENEQADKSERWFKRVAELDNNTDVTSEISDDDFPEIMPTRKGENRFVVNKKKDRSLTSPMYKRRVAMEQASNTNFIPFVPFPPGYFANKDRQVPEGVDSTSKAAGETSNSMMPGKLNDARPAVPDMDGVQQTENQQLGSGSGRWNSKPIGESVDRTKTVAVAYEASTNANLTQNSNCSRYSAKEMTKSAGSSYQPAENQSSGYSMKETTNFDRSSSQSSENQNIKSSWTGKSLEGSAVKEPDPEGVDSTSKAAGETSNSMMPGKLNDARPAVPDMDGVQQTENQQLGSGSGRWNSKPIGESVDRTKTVAVAYEASTNANLTQNSNCSRYSAKEMTKSAGSSYQPAENQSSGYSMKETTNFDRSSSQSSENQNIRSSWTGKSLEGSAVKEPDPLDMSEEAKAERWFRRVAQIKDISELSQIPDEDFPSIMPMRKGVNRFVVSKRKTPLERRLTSKQYRRNLPIVSSDPVKNESDSS